MATYTRFGTAPSLFEVGTGWAFNGHISDLGASKFTVTYSDGSTAEFRGSGLVWSSSQGRFTAGMVDSVSHSTAGNFNDSLTELGLTASALQDFFEDAASVDALRIGLLSGDDTLDGRVRINGIVAPVKLIGFAGDDRIYGGDGDDLLGGESGEDFVKGGDGNDRIFGGNENDTLQGGKGSDSINAGSGDDTMDGGSGGDVLYGVAGSDVFNGGGGKDTAVYTRSFHDLAIAKDGKNWIVTEPNGIDTLISIEQIAADDGIFVFDGASGVWERVGDKPGELLLNPGTAIEGENTGETINLAGTGKAIAIGNGGDDTLTGTSSYELLIGGDGDDILTGDPGHIAGSIDRLYGDDGNDDLSGGASNDLLYGGSGRDRIDGGNGSDEMTGGNGKDKFVFVWDAAATSARTWGADIIRDFQLGSDGIVLDFKNLPSGTNTTPTLSQSGGDALISLAGAGSIRIENIDTSGLTIGDFLA